MPIAIAGSPSPRSGEGGAKRRMGCGGPSAAVGDLPSTVVQAEKPLGDTVEQPPRYHQSARKFARAQRRNMTRAETILWHALRNHRLDGHGFRRQTPIGPYFADFVCLARKLIVEADGRTHNSADARGRDAERDAWLEREGFRVLRYSDDLVIGGLPIVIDRIRQALREP